GSPGDEIEPPRVAPVAHESDPCCESTEGPRGHEHELEHVPGVRDGKPRTVVFGKGGWERPAEERLGPDRREREQDIRHDQHPQQSTLVHTTSIPIRKTRLDERPHLLRIAGGSSFSLPREPWK